MTPAARRRDASELEGKAARKSSRAGTDTREKLLDAAERLFAEKGYDGTSLRDIAELANQNMALSTYHFGTKERLFEEVIRRRAVEIEALRLVALEQVEMAALSPSDAVRALIEAYASPMVRASHGASRQWQAHVRLMSQLIAVKRWLPIIRRNYDHCGQIFIDKFHEILPHADRNALLNAFSFMISTMLYVCSYTNRFNRMKIRPLSSSDEASSATENFIRFAHAGFMALELRSRADD